MPKFVITPEARRFAALELARRAGARLSEWAVDVSADETKLYLRSAAESAFVFPHFVREFQSGPFETIRISASDQSDVLFDELTPDFVIPYQRASEHGQASLFQSRSGSQHCTVDLLASILFTLSRVEERLSTDRDEHSRFPATASVAHREKFLHRPIVDEYGVALAQAVLRIKPRWKPCPAVFRALVTHDIDSVGIPLNPRRTVGRLLRTGRLQDAFRDLVSPWHITQTAELNATGYVSTMARNHGFSSATYWKASGRTAYDTGYDVRNSGVRKTLEALRRQGTEVGVHPSYGTFQNRSLLQQEVETLRLALGQRLVGGRQHYLRWRPETWVDWESCGLAYDSTVGFADQPGFRAGTAVPYRPWLLEENRQANLLEIPLIVMDGTLSDYMHLSQTESLSVVEELIKRTEAVGGVFTLLWHNTMALDRPAIELYKHILAKLSRAHPYNWNADLN